MTRESQAKAMIYITQDEYDELIAIKEIYERATAGSTDERTGTNIDPKRTRKHATPGTTPTQGEDATGNI